MNLTDFFHMGGYAFYVWTSYLIVFIGLVINLVLPLLKSRRLRKQLIENRQKH